MKQINGHQRTMQNAKVYAKREYERVAHTGVVTPPPYRNLDTRIIPREEQDRAERLYRERCASQLRA